ncbi:hypothetical protein [Candidatus Phytoplasma solani]|uniref:hypothetical protein n=1 Tax=Candidatus Phytoplasma solani TaxID=69896 RepID=UPI00358EB6D9
MKTTNLFALKDNEFYERTIRGTKIIHVMLEPNDDVNTVKNYIQENINSSFNGSVSSTPSYNIDQNGSIHWYVKDEEEILAVYFDGGKREGRDQNYDFVDLRWLGNGSPHMYCFWKIKEVDFLEHHNILEAEHFKINNPVLTIIYNGIPKIKNPTVKKLFEKIAQKITKKAIHTTAIGGFFISGISDLASEKLAKLVGDLLESNPDALAAASKIISGVEDVVMGSVDKVDNIPVVRELLRGTLEGFKTVGKATSYPANLFKGIITGATQQNYKEIENPLDLMENISEGVGGVAEGAVTATVNTVKDIGYGIKDTVTKFFSWW